MAMVTTNLLFDFDIDRLGLSDGTDITTLTDYGGGGHDAIGVTSHKPKSESTGGPNGLRYADFNGSMIAKTTDTDVLPSGTAERIVFIVFKCNNRTPAASNLVQYGPNGTNGRLWSLGLQGGNDNVVGYFWGSNTSFQTVGDISHWHAVALQQTSTGHPRWWVDGVDLGTDTGVNPNTISGTVLSIGGNGNSSNGDFVGKIARAIGHGALTDGEITAQFSYLADLYSPPTSIAAATLTVTAAMPDAAITSGAAGTLSAAVMTADAALPVAVLEAGGDRILAVTLAADAAMPVASLTGDTFFLAEVLSVAAALATAALAQGQRLSAQELVALAQVPAASLQPALSIGDPRDLQIQVYPAGEDPLTLDRAAQRPRWGSVAPGGDKQVTWAQLDYPPYDRLYDPNTPVSLVDALGEFFCALVEDPGGDFAPRVSMLEVLALGYSASAQDQYFTDSLVFDADEQPLTVFTAALAKMPLVQPDTREIGYIGANFGGKTRDFQGSTPQDLLNAMVRYGNSTQQPLIWLIRAAPVQPLPPFNFPNRTYLQVFARPTTPSLFVDLEDLDHNPFKVPRSVIYNRVTIRYRKDMDAIAVTGVGDPWTDTVTVNDLISQTLLGGGDPAKGIRELYEDKTSAFSSPLDAAAYATTKLYELAGKRAVGQGLSLTWPHPIVDEFGLAVAPWRTTHLVGRILRINNLSIGVSTDQMIVGADWDDASRQLSLATERVQSLYEVWDREHAAVANEVRQQLTEHEHRAILAATDPRVPDPHEGAYFQQPKGNTPNNPPVLNNDGKIAATVIPDELKKTVANAVLGNLKTGSDPLQVGDGLTVRVPACTLESWALLCSPAGSITVEARTHPAGTLLATGMVSGGITALDVLSPTVLATPIWIKFAVTATDGVVTHVNMSLDGQRG